MQEFEFQYVQSSRERYDTDMNDRAFKVVQNAGYEITEFGGGAMLSDDPDELGADCQIGFKATREQAEALKPQIEAIVGRQVDLVEVDW